MNISTILSIFDTRELAQVHINRALRQCKFNKGKELTILFLYAEKLNVTEDKRYLFIDSVYNLYRSGLTCISVRV